MPPGARHSAAFRLTARIVGRVSREAIGSACTEGSRDLPIASVSIVIASSARLANVELSGTRILTAAAITAAQTGSPVTT